MDLSFLRRIWDRVRGRRRTGWVHELSAEERRRLAANLRELTEAKRAAERAINAGAPQR